MDEVTLLIRTLTEYLVQLTKPLSEVDKFVTYWIPSLQLGAIILGGVFALWKYYFEKNREVYEKILREVYAPLYGYFVKQELLCHISYKDRNYKASPILGLNIKKVKTTYNSEGISQMKTEEVVLGLSREEFTKILECVNIGLASKELYTLLSMYKTLIYIEDNAPKGSDDFEEATIFKVDVENALRKEIISGYKLYHKRLKLPVIAKNDFYEIKDDNIEYNYKIDEKLKEELKQQNNN